MPLHNGLHARDGEVKDGSDGCSGRIRMLLTDQTMRGDERKSIWEV